MLILKIDRRIGKDEFWDIFNKWMIDYPRNKKPRLKTKINKPPLSKEEKRIQRQLYYQKHKEEIKRLSKEYHEKNREKILVRLREYAEKRRNNE